MKEEEEEEEEEEDDRPGPDLFSKSSSLSTYLTSFDHSLHFLMADICC